MCEHKWEPRSTVAMYRCAKCGGFGIKRSLRTLAYGTAAISPILCQKCDAIAVVLHGRTKIGHAKRMPRCNAHRGLGQELQTGGV